MKTAQAKQYFETIKTYISAMRMRVDDENVVKAHSLIAYLNERIIECNQEIAAEKAQETEEIKE